MTVSIPYPPTNGTLADGTQDNANFAAILAGLNNAMLRDGSVAMTGVLYMGGFKISGVGTPTLTTDAATMGYVTSAITSAITSAGYAPLASPAFTGGITVAGGVTATGVVAASGNVTTAGAFLAAGIEQGPRDVPQNAQSSAYTLALTDRAKHVYWTGGASTITVPANATVAFPIGSVVLIINAGTGTVTITRAGGVAVNLAGTGTNADHPLTIGGMATLIKVATDTWYAVGPGLS